MLLNALCTLLLVAGAAATASIPNVSLTFSGTSSLWPRFDKAWLGYNIDTANIYHHQNWSDPTLLNLAKQLTPALMRLGGTASNFIYFSPDCTPVSGRMILCPNDWKGILDFLRYTKAQLLYQFDPQHPRLNNGTYNFTEVTVMLQWAINNGYRDVLKDAAWQMGNEIGSTIDATQLGQDFIVLKSLTQAMGIGSRIIGPSIGGTDQSWTAQFLTTTSGYLDEFSFHAYGVAGECNVQNFLSLIPHKMIATGVSQNQALATQYGGPSLRTFLEVTTSLGAGMGCDGFSNRYIDGFWYLTTITAAAQAGVVRMNRHSLLGWAFTGAEAYFTLAGPPGWNSAADGPLKPHPDYFTHLLFKQIIGDLILPHSWTFAEADGSNDDKFQVSVWCQAGVTAHAALVYVNSDSQPRRIVLPTGMKMTPRTEWILTSSSGSFSKTAVFANPPATLTGDDVYLNGVLMGVTENGTVPQYPVPGLVVNAPISGIPVPAYSYGFIALDGAGEFDVCQPPPSSSPTAAPTAPSGAPTSAPTRRPSSTPRPTSMPTVRPTKASQYYYQPSQLRINCGGESFVDSNTNLTWLADTYFVAGTSTSSPNPIAGSGSLLYMYQTNRYMTTTTNTPVPMYSIPFRAGTWNVKMHFANSYPGTGQPGARMFDVIVNSMTIATNYDIVAAAGGDNTAVSLTAYNVSIEQGQNIDISFRTIVENPMMCGIEILDLTTPPPTMEPTTGPTAPSSAPTFVPTTLSPTLSPATLAPSEVPTVDPTAVPTIFVPPATDAPAADSTSAPSPAVTGAPSAPATDAPVAPATLSPAPGSTFAPTSIATAAPVPDATLSPVPASTATPSEDTTQAPSPDATQAPSSDATLAPSSDATLAPSSDATFAPSQGPAEAPTDSPTQFALCGNGIIEIGEWCDLPVIGCFGCELLPGFACGGGQCFSVNSSSVLAVVRDTLSLVMDLKDGAIKAIFGFVNSGIDHNVNVTWGVTVPGRPGYVIEVGFVLSSQDNVSSANPLSVTADATPRRSLASLRNGTWTTSAFSCPDNMRKNERVNNTMRVSVCEPADAYAFMACADGYTCGQEAVPCPPGFFCNSAAEAPQPCPAGYFQPNAGAVNSTACQACPKGTFCPSPSAAATPCPAGFFCPTPTTSLACKSGSFCPAGSTEPQTCTACPGGFAQECRADQDAICGSASSAGGCSGVLECNLAAIIVAIVVVALLPLLVWLAYRFAVRNSWSDYPGALALARRLNLHYGRLTPSNPAAMEFAAVASSVLKHVYPNVPQNELTSKQLDDLANAMRGALGQDLHESGCPGCRRAELATPKLLTDRLDIIQTLLFHGRQPSAENLAARGAMAQGIQSSSMPLAFERGNPAPAAEVVGPESMA